MKKITTITLIQAIAAISNSMVSEGKEVTAIQYEDGSGTKFNYQLDGGDWLFIDLSDQLIPY